MRTLICRAAAALVMLATVAAYAGAPVDAGMLDAAFGTGGKVRLQLGGGTTPCSKTAADVVAQPDGRIVLAGYIDCGSSSHSWIVLRLNRNGTLDQSFGDDNQGYILFYGGGHADNHAAAIALRSDGHILVGGTILDDNTGLVTGVVIQLTSSGVFDSSWGSGGFVYFSPEAGGAIRLRAIVIDTVDQYAAGVVYAVGQHTIAATGDNQFFYAGIAADGKAKIANSFQASVNPNVSESATTVAVQNGTGNIIVGGFAAETSGAVHCAAISTVISTNPAFTAAYLYTPFGTQGLVAQRFNLSTFDNDYCDAMTLRHDGWVLIGGRGTANTDGGSYQAALLGLFDNSGALQQHYMDGIGYPDLYGFDYFGGLVANDANTVNRLLLQPYDGKPIAVGYNADPHLLPASGEDMAVQRLTFPAYVNFADDPGFHAGSAALLDWGSSGSFASNDRALSATIDTQGHLIVVGYAGRSDGNSDLAIARFVAFDGIFKGVFDPLD